MLASALLIPMPLALQGVCTKCQPSAVTLQRQRYRHVDYVEFESASCLNSFIDAWRQSGAQVGVWGQGWQGWLFAKVLPPSQPSPRLSPSSSVQRLGYLFGRYERYDQVPLGIRAVVTAIYEPPQIGTPQGLELIDDPDEAAVADVAARLGLSPVSVALGSGIWVGCFPMFSLSSFPCRSAGSSPTWRWRTCRQARSSTSATSSGCGVEGGGGYGRLFKAHHIRHRSDDDGSHVLSAAEILMAAR